MSWSRSEKYIAAKRNASILTGLGADSFLYIVVWYNAPILTGTVAIHWDNADMYLKIVLYTLTML